MAGEIRSAASKIAAPATYEFHIAGTIGPVVRSALPEFAAVALPSSTVLTGTCGSQEDLQRLLDTLNAHDVPVLDLRITRSQRLTR